MNIVFFKEQGCNVERCNIDELQEGDLAFLDGIAFYCLNHEYDSETTQHTITMCLEDYVSTRVFQEDTSIDIVEQWYVNVSVFYGIVTPDSSGEGKYAESGHFGDYEFESAEEAVDFIRSNDAWKEGGVVDGIFYQEEFESGIMYSHEARTLRSGNNTTIEYCCEDGTLELVEHYVFQRLSRG